MARVALRAAVVVAAFLLAVRATAFAELWADVMALRREPAEAETLLKLVMVFWTC